MNEQQWEGKMLVVSQQMAQLDRWGVHSQDNREAGLAIVLWHAANSQRPRGEFVARLASAGPL